MKHCGLFAMNFILISVFAVVFIRSLHTAAQSSPVFVNLTGQGLIKGSYDVTSWTKQTFMSFRGIPYAESPSGKLRFKLAVRKLPWENIFDATKYGRRCPVISSVRNLSAIELQEDLEDCLNLCVYTKSLRAKQPVMFYIYGGGFYNGSNSDHPPHYLLEKDIVLVVPNYRIGALGWLSMQNEQMPGNSPVSDLLLALKWVQDYIYLFGGDPQEVTIFGQSAGAAMSGALLFSPKTPRGYIHRSIQQSGSIFTPLAMQSKQIKQVKRICQRLNCNDCQDSERISKCLHNVSVTQILDATEEEKFSPIYGDFYGILPQYIDELIGQYNMSIPIMTGFTIHDGSFVLAAVYDELKEIGFDFNNKTVRDFANILFAQAKDETGLANNVLSKMLFSNKLLYSYDHKAAIPAYFDLVNIIIMKSPVITLARTMFQKDLANVYMYTFDYEGDHTRFGYELGNDHYPFEGGVHHSDDNIYLFATHKLNARDTQMSKKMVEIWTSFAIKGKPSIHDYELPPMLNYAGPYVHLNEDISLDYDILQELTATVDDPENYKIIRENVDF